MTDVSASVIPAFLCQLARMFERGQPLPPVSCQLFAAHVFVIMKTRGKVVASSAGVVSLSTDGDQCPQAVRRSIFAVRLRR